MKKGMFSLTGLGLAAVLFVALQLLSAKTLTSTRFDLTEAKLYTLTDGSRNIVRDLDDRITLSYYFSSEIANKIPMLQTYGTRVRELLGEYEAASDGKLVVRDIDPTPFSEEEDAAVQAGLRGLPVSTAGELAYFGLVASNAFDENETIPFFDPTNEEFLEYELSRMIYKLAHPAKPVIGIMTPLPMQGGAPPIMPGAPPQTEPWFILDQLDDLFDVETVSTGATEIPENVDVLLIVHPKGLSPDTLYAIDQFVLAGGKTMVMVDPHCEEDRPPMNPNDPQSQLQAMQIPRNSDLGPLLAAWGVEFDSNQVVADRKSALTVTTAASGKPERIDFVAWLGLGPDVLNTEDPVTADLGRLHIPASGYLVPTEGATTTIDPLISTSSETQGIGADRLRFMPDPKGLLTDFRSEDQVRTIAARIHGPANTAFPDGPPSASADDDGDDHAGHDHDGDGLPDHDVDDHEDGEHGEEEGDDDGDDRGGDTPPGLASSVEDIHVVVVADADMIADKWWVEFRNLLGMRAMMQTSDNAKFIVNALDSLSGSTDLIRVRSRGRFERPFHKMDELRREAEERYRAREQALQDKLLATQRRITEMQTQREGETSMLLTPEQQEEIDNFRDEMVATRKELREVQHELRKDIDSLKKTLTFGNILGVPLLLLLAAVGSWFYRNK